MLLFWDITVTKPDKNGVLLWTPIFRVMMGCVEGSGDLGGCQLCLSPAEEGDEAYKFTCGTEDGDLVYATWSLPEVCLCLCVCVFMATLFTCGGGR
jgi:hypothetical protein